MLVNMHVGCSIRGWVGVTVELLKSSRAAAVAVTCAFVVASPGINAGQSARGDAGHQTTLAVPGRLNAHVSLAARGSYVVAVWAASAGGGATDIYAAISRDAGALFSKPVRVSAPDGTARVNGEQPPRVTLLPESGGEPGIAVVWTAKGAAGTRLLTAKSVDGGRTFSQPSTVPSTDAAGNRGWEAIASDARGRISLLWLDHRELASQDGQVAHQHHAPAGTATATQKSDGVAKAQLSKLYFATLPDLKVGPTYSASGGGKVGPPHPASPSGRTDQPVALQPRAVTGGVCYCCKTALHIDRNGVIYAAWRHVYPGNMRDIAFSVSRDSGRTFAAPVRVSRDDWQLEGCPDDGPALDVDGSGAIHIVWPTLVSEKGSPAIALFHALSRDGVRFSPRERLSTTGTPHHPQLHTTADRTIAITWDESAGGRRQVVMAAGPARVEGGLRLSRRVLSGSEPASYPAVTVSGSQILTAWTEGPSSGSIIRLARTPLPR
jgi:hypothetical protein